MVENPPGEKLSCVPRRSDPSARKHLQTGGGNSNTWRSPKRRRSRPRPPPYQLARFKVVDPLTGVKKLGFGKNRKGGGSKDPHVAANPISRG